MPAGNVSIEAVFDADVANYTVTLSAGEGAFAEAAEALTALTVVENAKISTATELESGSLPTPTKDNYVFIGWKKGATEDIISADDFGDEVVTADITYTAQYEVILSPRVPQNVAKLTTIDTDSTGESGKATLVGNRYVYAVPTEGTQPGLAEMSLASDNVYYDFDFMLPTDGLTLYTMFGDSKGGKLNYQIAQLEIKSANGKVNLTHTWSGNNASQQEQAFAFDAETELLTNTWYRAVIKTTAAGNTTKASGATITIYAVNHDGTVGDKIKSASYESLRTLNSGSVVNKLNLSSADTEAHPYVDNMFTYTDPSYDVTVTVTSDEGAVNGAKVTANDLPATNQTAAEDSNQVTLSLKAGTWTLTPEAAGFDAPEIAVTVTVPDETAKTITMTKKAGEAAGLQLQFSTDGTSEGAVGDPIVVQEANGEKMQGDDIETATLSTFADRTVKGTADANGKFAVYQYSGSELGSNYTLANAGMNTLYVTASAKGTDYLYYNDFNEYTTSTAKNNLVSDLNLGQTSGKESEITIGIKSATIGTEGAYGTLNKGLYMYSAANGDRTTTIPFGSNIKESVEISMRASMCGGNGKGGSTPKLSINPSSGSAFFTVQNKVDTGWFTGLTMSTLGTTTPSELTFNKATGSWGYQSNTYVWDISLKLDYTTGRALLLITEENAGTEIYKENFAFDKNTLDVSNIKFVARSVSAAIIDDIEVKTLTGSVAVPE